MIEVLQPEVLVVILGPALFFGYLILTNSSLLQRNISPSMLSKLFDKRGISKTAKNTLLLLSAIFLIIAYSRIVLVKKIDENVELKRSAALVLIEDRADKDRLKKAIERYEESKYRVAIYVLTNNLYMLYPQSRDYDFLEESLDNLSIYQHEKGVVDMQKTQPLKNRYDSVHILGIEELPELEPLAKTDMYVSVEELYVYPLGIAIVSLFVAIFIPFRFKWKLLLLLFTIYPQVEVSAGVLDFYYLDRAYESYEKGEYKEALEGFKMVDKNRAYYNIGNCYYKLGEYKEALKSYKKFEPQNRVEKFYKAYNEANCHFLLGEKQEAARLYQEALKIQDDPKAKINLELSQIEKKPQETEIKKKIPLLQID